MNKFIFIVTLFFILAFTTVSNVKYNNKIEQNVQDTIKPIDKTVAKVIDTVPVISTDSIIKLDTIAKTQYYYGIASFYSKNLEGTETSTQEIFRHHKFTCASNRFKLNTWLKVTNISNGKSIIVRVNDRMHPRMDKKGRIVDLSIAGAKKLNFIEKGITRVEVEVVKKPI